MRSAEIPKRTPDDPPPGTFRFTQDFNTNFLRTSNSGTARSELVNISENHGGESRRQQDPIAPKGNRRLQPVERAGPEARLYSIPRLRSSASQLTHAAQR